jgi:hypothetical protein
MVGTSSLFVSTLLQSDDNRTQGKGFKWSSEELAVGTLLLLEGNTHAC